MWSKSVNLTGRGKLAKWDTHTVIPILYYYIILSKRSFEKHHTPWATLYSELTNTYYLCCNCNLKIHLKRSEKKLLMKIFDIW